MDVQCGDDRLSRSRYRTVGGDDDRKPKANLGLSAKRHFFGCCTVQQKADDRRVFRVNGRDVKVVSSIVSCQSEFRINQ